MTQRGHSHYYPSGEAWLFTSAGRMMQRLEQGMPPMMAVRGTVHEMLPPASQPDALLLLLIQEPAILTPTLLGALLKRIEEYLTTYLLQVLELQQQQQKPKEDPQ